MLHRNLNCTLQRVLKEDYHLDTNLTKIIDSLELGINSVDRYTTLNEIENFINI